MINIDDIDANKVTVSQYEEGVYCYSIEKSFIRDELGDISIICSGSFALAMSDIIDFYNHSSYIQISVEADLMTKTMEIDVYTLDSKYENGTWMLPPKGWNLVRYVKTIKKGLSLSSAQVEVIEIFNFATKAMEKMGVTFCNKLEFRSSS